MESLLEHWKLLATIIGGVLLWYKDLIAIRLGIKKETVSLETATIENLQRNLDLYQEMVTDLDVRYKHKLEEIQKSFDESITKLQSEIEALKEINEKLKIYIEKQNKKLKYYEDNFGKSSEDEKNK